MCCCMFTTNQLHNVQPSSTLQTGRKQLLNQSHGPADSSSSRLFPLLSPFPVFLHLTAGLHCVYLIHYVYLQDYLQEGCSVSGPKVNEGKKQKRLIWKIYWPRLPSLLKGKLASSLSQLRGSREEEDYRFLMGFSFCYLIHPCM